jgi:hypothetical protein
MAFALGASTARAEGTELPVNLWVDGAVTLGSTAIVLGAQIPALQPDTCRWCESNELDDAARRATRWHNTQAAGGLSSSIAYATLPATVLGSLLLASQDEGHGSNLPADFLIVAEATMTALAANQVVKVAAARQRPRVHDPGSRASGPDDNLSFFSGHTTLAFSLATAAGTVATLRKYRFADWVWASGLVLAASVGYLRMAADEHYFSDVAVGALVGTSIGVALPVLLHSPKARVRVVPTPGGIGVAGIF